MATMSENQRLYLTNMMNGKTETGGAASPGNQAWAKAQLAKAPATTPAAPAAAPTTTQQPQSSPQMQAYSSAMMGNGSGAAGRIETPVTRSNQTIEQFQQAVNTPFQYKAEDDPAYHAAMATARQNIQQQQADTNAYLRASGQGKSSYSESVANQIGAKEMGRVSTEVVPQLINQAYMRNQDQLANMQRLYGMQNEQDFTNKVTEAQLTGNYTPNEAQQYINALVNYKDATEANWANMTPEQQRAARQEGDRVRMILQGFGIDPDLFGADVTAQAARGNVGRASGRTLDGRNQDYNMSADQRNFDRSVLESDRNFDFQKAQTEWENQFRQDQFDESKAARIWEQAFKEKSFNQSVEDAAAARGLQWASLNQREKEFIADQAWRDKQFAAQEEQRGIDNSFREAQFDAQQSAPGNYDFRADPNFADDIAFINADPTKAVDEVRSNAQALIQQYGYNGYSELLKAAEAAGKNNSPFPFK